MKGRVLLSSDVTKLFANAVIQFRVKNKGYPTTLTANSV